MRRHDQPASPRESKVLLFRYRRIPHHYDDTGEFAWYTVQIEALDGRVIAEINSTADYMEALDRVYAEAAKAETRND